MGLGILLVAVVWGSSVVSGDPGPIDTSAIPKDCAEVLKNGETTSGVYTIQPVDGWLPINVYCDMDTDGGGWTVFQRRQDGSVEFYRDWNTYRQGFGNLDGEFWLGNDDIYRITAQGNYKLRVDLQDFEGNSAFEVYDTFRVTGPKGNYVWTVRGYTGTAGHSLWNDGMPFSTRDQDNDISSTSCAERSKAGWWYADCYNANLNGYYYTENTDTVDYQKAIIWSSWKGYDYSLKFSEMKLRA